MAGAVGACPLREARDLHAGAAQRDHVLGVLLLVGREQVVGKAPEAEEGGAGGGRRGAMADEVTPSHRLPPG